MRSIKNVAVLTEDGAFALFFRPHPGGFDNSRVPTPGNLPSKAKKMLMPGGQPRGGGAGRRWNWLMHKVFSIKPALKATELTKVMESCTWSSGASGLITDNFFTVNYLKTSYHLFCSVLTVFLSMFIENDFKVPKVNYDESIACKELISSEKMFASNI